LRHGGIWPHSAYRNVAPQPHFRANPFSRRLPVRDYTENAERQINMDSILELKPLIRVWAKNANCTFKSERHFLDFVVGGQSLWEALGKKRDQVSILCVEYAAEETARAVGRLHLREKAYLPNDRCSLFVCSECGDLGCGTITALVERQGETITWKEFGYENTYEDKIWFDEYGAVGPFTFDATAYESTLLQGMNLLTSSKS
jgi:hypothetical protein